MLPIHPLATRWHHWSLGCSSRCLSCTACRSETLTGRSTFCPCRPHWMSLCYGTKTSLTCLKARSCFRLCRATGNVILSSGPRNSVFHHVLQRLLAASDYIAHVISALSTGQFQAYSNCRDFFDDRWLDLKEQVFGSAPDLFPADHFFYENFLWAVTTLRAHVHPPLQGSQVALVPLADLVGCLPAIQHLVDCIL